MSAKYYRRCIKDYGYSNAEMAYKATSNILKLVKELLEKEGELSIRQVALSLKSQWRTAHDALETLAELGVVKEKKGVKSERKERIFSLK